MCVCEVFRGGGAEGCCGDVEGFLESSGVGLCVGCEGPVGCLALEK